MMERMNGFLLTLVLIVFLAVPILNINRQKKAMNTIEQFRSQLTPGQRVETAGGLRGVVVEVKGDSTLLEVAPGLVVEWATQGIMRPAPEAEGSDVVTQGAEIPEAVTPEPENLNAETPGAETVGTETVGAETPNPEPGRTTGGTTATS